MTGTTPAGMGKCISLLCDNFGNVVDIPAGGKCATCGQPLEEVIARPRNKILSTLVIVAVAVAVAVLGIVFVGTRLKDGSIVASTPPDSSIVKPLPETIDSIQKEIDKIKAQIKASGETDDLLKRVRELENKLHIMQLSGESDEPSCLRGLTPELRSLLPLAVVPKSQGWKVKVHQYLHPYMQDQQNAVIDLPSFFIMKREVTIADFKNYAASLSPEERKNLSELWWQDEAGKLRDEGLPVGSIPYWAGNGYAEWLSKKTGCALSLPSQKEWVAAALRYAKPEDDLIRITDAIPPPQHQGNLDENQVKHLLGNMREWVSDTCDSGANKGNLIVGTDFKLHRDVIPPKPDCIYLQQGEKASEAFGFRLVLRSN